MKPIESNLEAILVAIPMILVMFVSFFKLDERFGSPSKPKKHVRRFSQMDSRGNFICVEPDGNRHRGGMARYAYGSIEDAGVEATQEG